MGPRVLVIDNYDSFVYNLVQYLGELGASPLVHRHDAVTIEQIVDASPDAILISPGPGRPEDAGVSNEVIVQLAGRVPSLGMTSLVHHRGVGVLAGLPDPFEATRYHSLVVDSTSVPDVLEVTATTDDGTVMALRHRELPVEGVQFHPESILTASGHQLMANFLGQVTAAA